MGSLASAIRVSLARTRADWPIVAAAWFITLLAAILFAAGLIYPSAASEAGLRRALADTPAGATTVDALVYAVPADAAAIDQAAEPVLQQVIAPLGGSIVRDWRTSAALALQGLRGSRAGDQAVLGYLEGVQDHVTLTAGAWPVDAVAPTDPVEVVVADSVAQSLGLEIGDELAVVAHAAVNPVTLSGRIVGTFSITDPTEAYWDGDDQLLTGLHENPQNRTFGPFLTTQAELLARAGTDRLQMRWHTFPAFDHLLVDDAGSLRARVASLQEQLGVATAQTFQVTTGLDAILGDAERSLLVSRTSVLLVMAQLAILAAYAIVLTASLLVDHRRIDTAMLRSRGASPRQIALLAIVEGLVLAVPAVVVAPWIAVAVLGIFNVAGPLADVGLRIDPWVSAASYVAAAAAGLVCVILLALPAALAARRFALEQGEISRQETRTFGQRMGLDIALLAVTGVALWQLRFYGGTLTRSVQGTLGLDPLLVAAPAIGLIAGGVLALRVLPLLAQAVEAAVSRGRSLVASLGSRQLARRPLRYTRSALLLMLAMSMGVFALSYATTWASSQRDQAAYQAGAPVRAVPVRGAGALPGWAIASAYDGIASVEHLSPVERQEKSVSFPLGGSVDMLALDMNAVDGLVLARGDEAAEPLGSLSRPLADGRPAPRLTALPEGTTYLRFAPLVDIRSIDQFDAIGLTEEPTSHPLDPKTLDVRVGVSAVIRDAHGLLYRVQSPLVPYDREGTEIVVPLQPATQSAAGLAAAAGAHLEGLLEVAAIGEEVWLPDETLTSNAQFGFSGLEAGSAASGPWTKLALDSANDPWTPRLGQGRNVLQPVPDAGPPDATMSLSGEGQLGVVFGAGTQIPAAVVSFLPASVASFNDPIPVIVNRALLDSLETAPGQVLTANLAGGGRRLEISGVVDTFPSTDPSRPLVLVDEQTLGLLRLQSTSGVRDPDEWWLSAKGGDVQGLADALRASPFNTVNLVTVLDRTRSLSTDPVALGIIGALTLGFVATGLFAIVGLTVSTAVGARQRRTEFALLRALGLSGRQLATSLWLENGSLVVVSIIAGTTLGLLIGWL
ncbi:MAG TPA: FtsX-like permease family protein, partial [Candidatus Limnocylindrales bacterium]|nr:FtsX-like permease family protein [Candidatus Limnocylindrales bacterium]